MKVLIVGAGMSGLCLGIQLQAAGIPFLILEKSPRLGGTWWENTYPGCACDIPSHLYGYSFAPNPEWSRVYPPQAEILSYVEGCAERARLLEHVRFGVDVTGARWSEERRVWTVSIRAGEALEADVLVSAVGALHVPRYPDLPGRESFAGPSFHSARWDHDVDLRGKRVGVIGNAASAVQFVPKVAEEAAELVVFQRTPHWVLPKPDRPYPAWLKRAFRIVPGLLRAYRAGWYLRQEAGFVLAFRQKSAVGWVIRHLAVRRIRRQVSDPAVRAALVPEYPPGCKRILLADDYYTTLERPHVRLVTDPLRAIEPTGVRTASGDHPLDVLIYATGFDPLPLGRIDVVGRGGERLDERWAVHPSAYLGMTVPEFPNYFLLLGPNTGLGHNSVMWMVECQVNYVLACLRAMRRRGARELEVRREALARYEAELARRLGGSVWASCSSWYKNDQGLIFALWPGTTAEYWWRTRRPHVTRDFELRA